MMLRSFYQCSSCRERFDVAPSDGCYHFNFDRTPFGSQIPSSELYRVPVRPCWCKDCAAVAFAEDIPAVRVFEEAYAAVRAGRPVEFPLETGHLDPPLVQEQVATYLRWRLLRRHPPRSLCCGGTNYLFMDVPQPLFKHEGCDFGFIESWGFIGGGVYRAPTALNPANIRVYSEEGDLIGLLTWQPNGPGSWNVIPAAYEPRERTDEC
jgi:hypothetical protein